MGFAGCKEFFRFDVAVRSVRVGKAVNSTVAQQDSIAGVVLAAGAGNRYGMPKVLADGGAWLRAAVGALHDGGCVDVAVVLGAAVTGVEVPSPARAVIAHDWADGVSASVRAGLLALGDDIAYAVLTTVDTPDVGAAAVARVVAAAHRSGLARARYGSRPGHPVVIARRHWPALLEVLAGDEGAGPFLRSRADVVAVDCGDLGSGRDVDEPR